MKADASSSGPEVREAALAGDVSRAGARQNGADERPCSGTDVGPIAVARGNASDGGGRVVAGGGDEARAVEGRKRGEWAGEPAKVGAGGNEFRRGGQVQTECGEDLRAPVFGFAIDEASVRGVGVFGDPASA